MKDDRIGIRLESNLKNTVFKIAKSNGLTVTELFVFMCDHLFKDDKFIEILDDNAKKLVEEKVCQDNADKIKKNSWYRHSIRNCLRQIYYSASQSFYLNDDFNIKPIVNIIAEHNKFFESMPKDIQEELKKEHKVLNKFKQKKYLISYMTNLMDMDKFDKKLRRKMPEYLDYAVDKNNKVRKKKLRS